jgi:hypothetical protein
MESTADDADLLIEWQLPTHFSPSPHLDWLKN